jgi:hypothetical protein
MAKRLACWLGRHTWETRVYEGDTYKVCVVCGKLLPDGGTPPHSGDNPYSGHPPKL